jgi:hypothetical protein
MAEPKFVHSAAYQTTDGHDEKQDVEPVFEHMAKLAIEYTAADIERQLGCGGMQYSPIGIAHRVINFRGRACRVAVLTIFTQEATEAEELGDTIMQAWVSAVKYKP